MCDPLVVWTLNILVVVGISFIVVPLHKPEFTSIFLNNITNARSFNSNLCNGSQLIFIEFKHSMSINWYICSIVILYCMSTI